MYNYVLAGFIFISSFSALSLFLSPEAKRALNHFNEETEKAAISLLPPLNSIDELNDFKNGKFGQGPITTKLLPRGIYWLWNQSRGKNYWTNDKNWEITFYKLNTRLTFASKADYSSAPEHKLWVFNIKSPEYNNFHFLWLEKYDESDHAQKYDFSFLFEPAYEDRYNDLPLWLNDNLENLPE